MANENVKKETKTTSKKKISMSGVKKTVTPKTTTTKKRITKKATAKTGVKKTPAINKTISEQKAVALPEKEVSTVEKRVLISETAEEIPKAEVTKEAVDVKAEKKEVKIEEKTFHEHFGVYLFLLSAVLICLHVMARYNIEISTITVGCSVFLFPTVYFIANVITKKFDFKKTVIAILTSSIAMLLFVYLSKYLNTKVVDYFVIYGQVFAYIISQLLNLIIYYYLLVNTELKARWIYITYLFAILSYYFISIILSTRVIITDTFWVTVFCSTILSALIAIMYAFFDSLIERGHK